MIVTKTEFETNASRYLELVSDEEIIITNGGEFFATLTGAKPSLVDSLVGLIPSTVTDAEVKRERLGKYENSF